jgi:GMP synthase-like glutamine amidotransferase
MICYVDLEHPTLGPSLVSEGPAAAPRKAELVTWKMRFEQLSGIPCLLQHFTQVSPRRLAAIGTRAVILSGHSTLIDDYDPASLAPLIEVIRETALPLLGLCGGHQLMGLAFGAAPQPMGPLGPGEVDPRPQLAPGMRKEWGPSPVHIYGVQFHPERYTLDHPDGRAILANFFRLAGLGRPAAAAPVHA